MVLMSGSFEEGVSVVGSPARPARTLAAGTSLSFATVLAVSSRVRPSGIVTVIVGTALPAVELPEDRRRCPGPARRCSVRSVSLYRTLRTGPAA